MPGREAGTRRHDLDLRAIEPPRRDRDGVVRTAVNLPAATGRRAVIAEIVDNGSPAAAARAGEGSAGVLHLGPELEHRLGVHLADARLGDPRTFPISARVRPS
jgi:hypothetical protein